MFQGWAENADDLNSWHGVTVDKHDRVLRLDLSRNNLDGEKALKQAGENLSALQRKQLELSRTSLSDEEN